METEAQLIVQRASLRWLAQQHPSWTHQELARALGKSLAWVKKWLKRLHEAAPGDVMALHARSRERLTPPASLTSQTAVVQRILEIGESPPENLHRIPGPEAILYSLHRDPELRDLQGCACRVSLRRCGRSCACLAALSRSIAANPDLWNASNPVRRSNLTSKMPPPCPPIPMASENRVVEITNFVDAGTSIWLSRSVGGDFDAESEARRSWRSFCANMVCPPCSPLTMIRVLWEAPVGVISPQLWCGFCCAWGSNPMSARRISPKKRPTLNDFTARLVKSACVCNCHRRLNR